MANTFATKKQAEAIKQRMAEIRTDLPYEVDEARARARQLADWKYHMARRPLPILAAATVLGYLLVPAKRSSGRVVIERDASGANGCSGNRYDQPGAPGTGMPGTGMPGTGMPGKRGLLGGIVGAVTTMAVKQATSIAATQLSNFLSKRGA